MMTKVKLALKLLSNALVVITVLLAFLLHGMQLFGLTPLVVLSGSMESVYPTGAILYIRDVDPATLAVGDTITFKLTESTLATHRIIEIVQEGGDTFYFRTKGDENDVADGSLVAYSSVVGKPVFCIPQLGYLSVYIAQPPGKYVAITVALALILIEIMLSMLLDGKDKKKQKTEEPKISNNKE